MSFQSLCSGVLPLMLPALSNSTPDTNPWLASGLVATFVTAVGSIGLSVYTAFHQSRRERERTEEQLSLKLLEARIPPYAALMKKLSGLSKTTFRGLPSQEQKRRADYVGEVLHRAIYGQIGILASTATRETILCARARCRGFAQGECLDDDPMFKAVWAVHQMLRADLNHFQDDVIREFDRLRKGKKKSAEFTKEVIESLIAGMPHAQFKPSPDDAAGKHEDAEAVARKLFGGQQP